jgi:hypothetical protein
MFRNLNFALLLAVLPGLFCAKSDELSQQEKAILLYLLTGDATSADYGAQYAKLYYVKPTMASGKSADHLALATNEHTSLSGKKVIIIHGWQATDSDKAGNPSDLELRERIYGYYKDNLFEASSNGIAALQVLNGGYHVFMFTYLTSNGVDINGIRFRNRMDLIFNGQIDTVNIIAHSMGGLVSRFAVYEGDEPAYINRITTLGTPFHGSPWASSKWQKDNTFLGTAAAFFTGTTGGSDLAWDGILDGFSNGTNAKLILINQKTDRDSLFHTAFYGNIDNSSPTFSFTSENFLSLGCSTLFSSMTSNNANSDCIVPQNSATFLDHAGAFAGGRLARNNYAHKGIHLGIDNNTSGSDTFRGLVFATLP